MAQQKDVQKMYKKDMQKKDMQKKDMQKKDMQKNDIEKKDGQQDAKKDSKNPERDRALNAALAQIERQFGKGSIDAPG